MEEQLYYVQKISILRLPIKSAPISNLDFFGTDWSHPYIVLALAKLVIAATDIQHFFSFMASVFWTLERENDFIWLLSIGDHCANSGIFHERLTKSSKV